MIPSPVSDAPSRSRLFSIPTLLLAAALLTSLSCNRRKSLCPEGMNQVAVDEVARSIWCEGKNGEARWIERHAEGGTRRQSCAFQNGILSGPFESWHTNGSAWITGAYEAGKKTARWDQRNPTGRKAASGTYRDGDLIEGAPVGMVSLCETVTPFKRK